MTQNGQNSTDYSNTQSYTEYFGTQFLGLENLSLVEAPNTAPRFVKPPGGIAPNAQRKPVQSLGKKPTGPDMKKPIHKKPDALSQVEAVPSGPIRIHPDPQHRQMTTEEKTKLKINIGKLTLEQKKGVVPIVQKCVSKNGANPIFEFELDQLTSECLRELEVYVNK